VGPDDTYDVKKYLEMLVKATEEILIHFGYDAKRLKKMIDSFSHNSEDGCAENNHKIKIIQE
jgi:hypothetical protein